MSVELFTIADSVHQAFPEIKVGTAVVRGVQATRENARLEKLKTIVVNACRTELTGKPLAERPRVQAFRRIYKKFGVDPTSRRPSAEALLRRTLDPQKGLFTVNTVVDAYNLSSLEAELPMAAYDLAQVALPVTLRFARSGDTHRPIGQEQPDRLSEGELVYADQRVVLCRDFNYRDADETKVTLATRDLLVFVDGCSEVTE